MVFRTSRSLVSNLELPEEARNRRNARGAKQAQAANITTLETEREETMVDTKKEKYECRIYPVLHAIILIKQQASVMCLTTTVSDQVYSWGK